MFACPICVGDLERHGASWHCQQCNATYPDLGGLACLMPRHDQARAGWIRDARSFAIMMADARHLLALELQRPDLLLSTRRRLKALLAANVDHESAVLRLLAHAGIEPGETDTSKRVTSLPDLVREQEIALRDWAWRWPLEEQDENAMAHAAVDAAWPSSRVERILVLGAGAGRLAWDLHVSRTPERTIALDRNPLNLLIADHVLRGAPLLLHELPFAPRRSAESVVLHAPRQPSLRPPGFELVIADAAALPFAAASFDLVITSWFIDVVDVELSRLLSAIHGLLAETGAWINHGPLVYPGQRSPAERRTFDEVEELVSLAGFEVGVRQQSEADRLHSPHDTRRRREQVYVFRAHKRPFDAADDERRPPAWQLLPHRPVPREALKMAADSDPLLATVASLVDGYRSTEQIATLLARHPDMMSRPKVEPLAATRALLWHLAGLLDAPASAE